MVLLYERGDSNLVIELKLGLCPAHKARPKWAGSDALITNNQAAYAGASNDDDDGQLFPLTTIYKLKTKH